MRGRVWRSGAAGLRLQAALALPAAVGPHPQTVTARYDRHVGRVVVGLINELEVAFEPQDMPGLQHASSEQLARIEISPSGQDLHPLQIDADLFLLTLLKSLPRKS